MNCGLCRNDNGRSHFAPSRGRRRLSIFSNKVLRLKFVSVTFQYRRTGLKWHLVTVRNVEIPLCQARSGVRIATHEPLLAASTRRSDSVWVWHSSEYMLHGLTACPA